ncbi:hypothetical protein L484_023915 [Morus notabilis]|uniref:Uncharacterized protein n=1 Tax=Morus notabilis TaxID=981085 RepID=W9RNR3_9ROSA|nr:hypothetical protein L484_023915 [Morus notabilis]
MVTGEGGEGDVPVELLEATRERGYMVGWVPQEEVLAHQAVVWKLGIDVKNVCDRKVVENMVSDLMVERREEFVRSTAEMARLARKRVSEGGSSYCNLDRLIEDIRLTFNNTGNYNSGHE